MKCVVCKQDNFELLDGKFIRNGSVKGALPKHDFKCADCLRGIDNTSKEPDEPIQVTDW